ncbi:MAG: hypothetical protein ACJZ59_04550 [Candidatus Thalassarchaeaceae archaeon]
METIRMVLEGDRFPADPARWKDSDRDGVADEDDAFPNEDRRRYADTDGDGYGDDPLWGYGGMSSQMTRVSGQIQMETELGDNADAFPFDPSQQVDSDGDGFGDNPSVGVRRTGSQVTRAQWSDIDGDGFGDNHDRTLIPDQVPNRPNTAF